MEGIELLSFQIISFTGSARSSFIEAINAAKSGDLDRANELMVEGEEQFVEGHKVHSTLIQQEAKDQGSTEITLLLIHAQDQMMSAEIFKTIAAELIDITVELIDIRKKIQ